MPAGFTSMNRPGPIWTPLIPSTLPEDSVTHFGKTGPDEAPRPAGRARHGVRDAGGSSVELRVGGDYCRDWWQANHLGGRLSVARP